MQVFARHPARNRGKFATPVRAFGDPLRRRLPSSPTRSGRPCRPWPP